MNEIKDALFNAGITAVKIRPTKNNYYFDENGKLQDAGAGFFIVVRRGDLKDATALFEDRPQIKVATPC